MNPIFLGIFDNATIMLMTIIMRRWLWFHWTILPFGLPVLKFKRCRLVLYANYNTEMSWLSIQFNSIIFGHTRNLKNYYINMNKKENDDVRFEKRKTLRGIPNITFLYQIFLTQQWWKKYFSLRHLLTKTKIWTMWT